MSVQCREIIGARIRENGPLTFADFMDLALYHPEAGYYATAAKRSGGSGDFYTSVDVGPVFGELLAQQFAEMARVLVESGVRSPGSGVAGPEPGGAVPQTPTACPPIPDAERRTPDPFDLVEAGAGNGRLSRDALDALDADAPDVYARVRLYLAERSAEARKAQAGTLGRHAARLASSSPGLPPRVDGVIFANELLDALPTHVVVAGEEGLREVFVDVAGDRLVEREMALSTPALGEYFAALGVRLLPGSRAEVNLRALEWVRAAAATLRRGFLVLVDYGHEAETLYSPSHSQGTLSTFTGHVVQTVGPRRSAPWLRDPGSCDITTHVDFTSVGRAAEAAGLVPLCRVDQMHFILALGVEARLRETTGSSRDDLRRRLALKTLLIPGGLGTTHHVMIFGKDVGRPRLRGCGERG